MTKLNWFEKLIGREIVEGKITKKQNTVTNHGTPVTLYSIGQPNGRIYRAGTTETLPIIEGDKVELITNKYKCRNVALLKKEKNEIYWKRIVSHEII